MYNVIHFVNELHGSVVEIVRDTNGLYKTPHKACQAAKSLRNKLLKPVLKIRYFVDGKVFNTLASWQKEEYDSLVKCERCYSILDGNVFSHSENNSLFCSQKCADVDFIMIIESNDDNEETEFYL